MVNQPFQCKAVVEGQLVNDIVLDTGCSRTLVRSNLLGEKKFEGETVTVQCTNGDLVTYPLVRVELEVNGRALTVKAAVSDTLAQSVLLGTDVTDLSELLKAERHEKAFMAVTHSQIKRAETNRTEQAALEKIEEVTATPSQKEAPSNGSLEPERSDVVGQSDVWLTECNFDEDIFVGTKNRKEKKSKSEKREDRYKHARQKSWYVGDMTLDISRKVSSKRRITEFRV